MKKVFLDANVVIENFGKSPYGSEFARVIDLIESEQIRILTTDLTVAEVIRRHVNRDFGEMKCICNPKLHNMVEETIDTEFPAITEKQLQNALRKKYRNLVEDINDKLDAKLLKIGGVKSTRVLSQYINEIGFFGNGSGKKYQFPDAFIFERLKDEASENEPLIIVSKDKDFIQPVNDQVHISLVNSLPGLFSELGLELEDPKIEQFLEKNYDEITKMVNDELWDWNLEGDIENSEITETDVTDVVFQKIISFKSAQQGSPIWVVGKFRVMTIVGFTYLHENTGVMYDPEYHDMYLDTVDCQNEIELKIDVSLSVAVDDKGNPIHIEALEFRNANFIEVELEPCGDDWYEF